MAVSKTIPPLEGFREISTAQRDEFRENGHVMVRGLLGLAEVGVYRQLIVDAVKRQSRERRKSPERGIYGRAFGQMVNLGRGEGGGGQVGLCVEGGGRPTGIRISITGLWTRPTRLRSRCPWPTRASRWACSSLLQGLIRTALL